MAYEFLGVKRSLKSLRGRWDDIARISDLIWTSLFRVNNLENSLDGIVGQALLDEIGRTPNVAMLTSDALDQFCDNIRDACVDRFREEFGASIKVVRLIKSGPPAEVNAMTLLVGAIRDFLEVARSLVGRQ